MILEQWIGFFILFNVTHIYGLAENRLFKESGELLPGNHFRIYHLMMAGMALTLGYLVWIITHNYFLTVATAVYFPLGLDIAWWVKRYFDFTYPYWVLKVEKWNWYLTLKLGRERAEKFYNEKNAWHEREDWDNYGKFKIYGWYLWWYIFGVLSFSLIIASLV